MKPVVSLLALALALGAAGCSKQSEGSSSATAAKSYTIAVIPKGTTHRALIGGDAPGTAGREVSTPM